MKRLALLAVLAACGDRSPQDVADDVNAKIVECEVDAWNRGPIPGGGIKQCAEVCKSKPPVNAEPLPDGVACNLMGVFEYDAARWIEVDGTIGVCGWYVEASGDAVVRWWPCEGQ